MGIKRFIALAAMMANAMPHDNIFVGGKQRSGMTFNPDYRPVGDRKELRRFRIKGEEIEAYSRKDAIKRLKHKKQQMNTKKR